MTLLIIGYYYRPNNALINFKNLTKKFSQNFKLVKLEDNDKISSILNALIDIKEDVICIINIEEIILCSDMTEIYNKFMNYKCKLLFPSQTIIEAGIDLKTYWNNEKQKHKEININKNFKLRKDFIIPANKYLNISAVIGEKTYLIKYLEFIKNNSLYEEQKMGGYFIELNNELCKLDDKCEIFGVISGINFLKNNNLIYYKFEKNRITNIKNSNTPSILCFPNTRQDFNLRMYKYGKLVLKNLYHHNVNYTDILATVLSFLPMIFINKITFNYILILMGISLFFIYYFFCLYL